VLNRILIGLLAAGAALMGVPGMSAADPDPAPPPPPPLNLNALAPVKPSDYAMQNGGVYAFAIPGDIACVMSRDSGSYGCSGPIPAAPNGANAVTGAQQGPPGFANADRPLYVFEKLPQRLEPGTRISFRNVTCGTDGTTTQCTNSFDGAGFVISPAGSFILEPSNPLLLNTGQGHNPYFN
jgi:hypothetical protein